MMNDEYRARLQTRRIGSASLAIPTLFLVLPDKLDLKDTELNDLRKILDSSFDSQFYFFSDRLLLENLVFVEFPRFLLYSNNKVVSFNWVY